MLCADWYKSPLSIKQQKNILRQIVEVLRIEKDQQISIAFVSQAVIKRLNRLYRGENKVTDVLSFPFGKEKMVGEILICLQQAKKQAKNFGLPAEEEIVILLVHGILHLFGYNHSKEREAKKMFFLQKKILKKLDIIWRSSKVG